MKYFVILSIFLLLSCEKPLSKSDIIVQQETENSNSVDAPVRKQTAELAKKFVTVNWEELIPKTDLDAIANPPDYIVSMSDGSESDQLESAIKSAMNPSDAANDIYEQALVSTNIIEAMNGKDIRIPGFIVPVEFINDKQISSFFLVPYFGACLHMPPPPPNQIIYVETGKVLDIESIYEPVWVTGKLSTELFEDKIATAAYVLKLESLELYYQY